MLKKRYNVGTRLYAQFSRILEGVLIVLMGALIGQLAYMGLVSLFHYQKFTSFDVAWQILFSPTREQIGISHMVGRAIQALAMLGCLWEGGKTAIGLGKRRISGAGRGLSLIHI